jgi:hypothetical protein
MSKYKETVEYTDEPIQIGERVPDFLPPPEEIAKARTLVYISIGIDLKSLDFFKEQAKLDNTSYEEIISRLLDEYVQHQQQIV